MRSRLPLILASNKLDKRSSFSKSASSVIFLETLFSLKEYFAVIKSVKSLLVLDNMLYNDAELERKSEDLTNGWYSLMTSMVRSRCNFKMVV